MRVAAIVAGILLGLAFLFASVSYFAGWMPQQDPPPADSAIAHFFAAFAPTGYFGFVKALELIGGLLVAIPPTRRLGLLVLGPIIVNIIAFQVYVAGDAKGLLQPMMLGIIALALFLVWADRKAWLAFIRGR